MTVLDKSYFLATGITLSVCSKDHSHPISTNSTLNETVLESGLAKRNSHILGGLDRLAAWPSWPIRIQELWGQEGLMTWDILVEGLVNLKMGAVLISIFFCMFHQHKPILPFYRKSNIILYFQRDSFKFQIRSNLFCIKKFNS